MKTDQHVIYLGVPTKECWKSYQRWCNNYLYVYSVRTWYQALKKFVDIGDLDTWVIAPFHTEPEAGRERKAFDDLR